jgi:hypothetical protein
METSQTDSLKGSSLRGAQQRLPRLQVVIPYTTPHLTAVALKSAAGLTRNLGATVRLICIQVVPYPCPLNQPNVDTDHLKDRLRELARESELPVRAELIYTRDREATFRRVLRPGSLVLIATERCWWRTAQEKLARWLLRAGHSVALLPV